MSPVLPNMISGHWTCLKPRNRPLAGLYSCSAESECSFSGQIAESGVEFLSNTLIHEVMIVLAFPSY